MSSTASPIAPARFAEAITSLPLANLHLKAAELRNSIAHLQHSNRQLKSFAEEGDRDCADAVIENEEVMRRMEERIALLRAEFEGRGFKWGEDEGGNGDGGMNGHAGREGEGEGVDATSVPEIADNNARPPVGTSGGRLDDEELARRLRERMEEDEDGEGDGVHL